MVMYPACVYPQLNDAVIIEVPDYKISVRGENMLDAMSLAIDTISAVYYRRKVKGIPIPEPSELSDIKLIRKLKKSFKAMVYIDPEVCS